jgi:putative peptidoglycan lipid II flippase
MFKSDRRILKASGINLVFNLFGKALNYFALSILVAYFFGASWKTDAYVMGGIIPFWIMTVILYGFNSCFIPVFIHYKNTEGEESAQRMVSAFAVASITGLSLFVLIGIVTSSRLLPLYTPGFDSQGLRLAVSLSKWIFFSLLFSFIAALLSNISYSYHKYLVPAVSSVILPLAIITNILVLHKRIGIFSLISGLISGAILQILWMFGYLRKIQKLSLRKGNLKHPGLKKIFYLFIPIAIGGMIYPLYLIITRMLASTLGEGAIANLDFAQKIVLGITLPMSAAISISILPTLSEIELISEKHREELNRVISLGVNILSFFLIPIGLILITLRLPIVQLLLERGAFHYKDSLMTAQILKFLGLVALIEPLNAIFLQIMYALKDTPRLLIATSSGLAINILAAVVLIKPMGIQGIALSVPLGQLTQVLLLFFIVKAKLKYRDIHKLMIPYLKIGLSAAVMVGLTHLSLFLLKKISFFSIGGWQGLMAMVISIFIGGLSYLGCLLLLQFQEFKWIGTLLREKLAGKTL